VTTKLAGSGTAFAVALQADGKIVAAGDSERGKSNATDCALARYTPAGRLDRSFSKKGWVLTDMGGRADIANDIALAPTGAIVVAGGTGQLSLRPSFAAFALARYEG
jgi:uncharacterized delta-60 repeat protein